MIKKVTSFWKTALPAKVPSDEELGSFDKTANVFPPIFSKSFRLKSKNKNNSVNFASFSPKFLCSTLWKQFRRIRRCCFAQITISLAQWPKLVSKRINFTKRFLSCKIILWTSKMHFDNISEKLWPKNYQVTPKCWKNFSLSLKLLKKSLKTSEKAFFQRKFLWTRRMQCR